MATLYMSLAMTHVVVTTTLTTGIQDAEGTIIDSEISRRAVTFTALDKSKPITLHGWRYMSNTNNPSLRNFFHWRIR